MRSAIFTPPLCITSCLFEGYCPSILPPRLRISAVHSPASGFPLGCQGAPYLPAVGRYGIPRLRPLNCFHLPERLTPHAPCKRRDGRSPSLQAGEISTFKETGFSRGAPGATQLPQCRLRERFENPLAFPRERGNARARGWEAGAPSKQRFGGVA